MAECPSALPQFRGSNYTKCESQNQYDNRGGLVPEPSPQPPEPRTIDDKIDDINEQLEGIRQEIAGVRSEIGKLNQRGGVN